MAMGKNKTGIMAAITAAAGSTADAAETRERAQRTLPKGTIGSVRAGLGGIQEIDPGLILPWGPKDRLEVELTAVNSGNLQPGIQDLADSIASAGQQIPVLLRPSKDRDGYFEVIYGRRRILACKHLDIPVKALIRTLDDTDALKAKGLENASRTELSYYERARFAHAILEQGFSRSETIEALAISKNTLSQLERIVRLVPMNVGDAIGAAPEAGRPKWMALATLFDTDQLTEQAALKFLAKSGTEPSSDNRLDALIAAQSRRGPQDRISREQQPIPGVSIRSGKSSLQLSIARKGSTEKFADWLDLHLEGLIKESFERFQSESPKG
ncbi:plasmid partitioning protein RepB [uncultured Roseobacter sp.]|uniref:plasmid partitioning protein RepB n=1 Tax=uncultured Roseobacter sp. TaxID=114847 RepID=UPI0026190EDE|nr:plasmid partitioning protein RepB [uncultured Roseobacter sp.]